MSSELMSMVRETYPDAKVLWIREEGQEDLGGPPDEPGTYWMDGGVWEQSVRLYEQQTMPKRGR